MATLSESMGTIKKPWQWIAVGGAVLLIWAVVALPRYNSQVRVLRNEPVAGAVDIGTSTAITLPRALSQTNDRKTIADSASLISTDAIAGRKIIGTASMSMVVGHPAEVADKIAALAAGLGGYVETSESAGDNATTGTLTIRIPAARFDLAKTEIRKLGIRIESENVGAQDVTRQYVDQDASLRNLKAQETQYLAIMKQAATVQDMLAVSEQLSNVRGQIERQQAEFNILSQQTETVSIAISLRTEAEARVPGLNWRPGYQMRIALRDGLEGVANFAAAMVGVLFYLPAIFLWAGTILGSVVIGFKTFRWVGRRLGWKAEVTVAARKS